MIGVSTDEVIQNGQYKPLFREGLLELCHWGRGSHYESP
jgi:hypothetical protein